MTCWICGEKFVASHGYHGEAAPCDCGWNLTRADVEHAISQFDTESVRHWTKLKAEWKASETKSARAVNAG